MMRAALPRRRRADGEAALAAALAEAGTAIVEDALSPDELAAQRAALSPWFDQAACGEGPFFGRKTRRFSGLFAKAPETAALALDPLTLPAVETALGAGAAACDCIQLNLTQAIAIEPGEGAQYLHRDAEFFPLPLPCPAMANVLWTLDPFTEENGATRIAPGSHVWPTDRFAADEEIAVAEAPAGAAILWMGATLHGGGANRSPAPRRAVVMSYSLAWLAPAEKLLLSTPPELAKRLPERLQRLIGYQIHRPNLGWVEGRDPLEWLNDRVGDIASAKDNLRPEQARDLGALLLGE